MRFALLALLPSLVLACQCQPSEFVPNTPDGGPSEEGVSADDIGVPCVYDPAVGDNPTNQCPAGTECVIVTSDGRFNTLGMTVPFWEDQLTVATVVDGAPVDIGYCSVVGNQQNLVCPIGTLPKFFPSPQAAGGLAGLCMKPCQGDVECGAERVCDARYVDNGLANVPFCVSPCRSDISHCVRSSIVALDDQGTLATGLFANDIFGGSVCNLQSGICEAANKGVGTDGAQCTTSADCADGFACYQSQLFFDAPDFGFCAKRCTLNVEAPGQPPEQGTCDAGEACQPGLNFGYPAMVVFDQQLAVASREGICLDTCVEGLTECTPGAVCGATDASVMGQAWIGEAMCAPPAIREDG